MKNNKEKILEFLQTYEDVQFIGSFEEEDVSEYGDDLFEYVVEVSTDDRIDFELAQELDDDMDDFTAKISGLLGVECECRSDCMDAFPDGSRYWKINIYKKDEK